MQGELTNMIATIGENMTLRRVASLSVSDGVVAGYMHNAVAPDLGKIGVLVALEFDRRQGQARGARQAARHARGRGQPAVADRRRPRQGRVERERAVLAEKAGQTGKAADIIAKMVEGGLRKFHQEVVLLEQVFVIDGKTKVSQGRRRRRQAGRRAGPLAGFTCASTWARASRRSPRTSRPRWPPRRIQR